MRYIKFIILSVIGAIVLFGCTGKTEQAKAKYVFYFIGDGMGVNQVIGTEMYLAELEGRIGTKSLSFTSFPVRNYLTTYSATNAVTCSAAAGTALVVFCTVLPAKRSKPERRWESPRVLPSIMQHPLFFTRINRIGRCITRSERMPLKPNSILRGSGMETSHFSS